MSNVMHNLEKLGQREIDQMIELMTAYRNCAKPDTWANTDVHLGYNLDKNYFYLANTYNQHLIVGGDYGFCLLHTTPWEGIEGVLPELCEHYLENGTEWASIDDQSYLLRAINAEMTFFNTRSDNATIVPLLKEAQQHLLMRITNTKEHA